MSDICQDLLELLQLYSCREQDTTQFREISHDDLVRAANDFLFHHSPRFGISGWGDNTQSLRDGGVDSVWHYRSSGPSSKLGIQVKSYSDFQNGNGESFRCRVMAQIAESRQADLRHLILALGADLTSSSHRRKCRGLMADIERMKDGYVVAVSPEKLLGLWRWHCGLPTDRLEQIREAGYAWLTAVYDSLGNLYRNSMAKQISGAWSHPRATVVRSGQEVTFRAIAVSPKEPVEFRFSVQRSGGCFVVRRDWSPHDWWTWRVEDGDIGRDVIVMVCVRRPKAYFQFGDNDDYAYATYDVMPAAVRARPLEQEHEDDIEIERPA
jgi:hypothetical protein